MGEVGQVVRHAPGVRFETTYDIIAALRRHQDFYDPTTSSLLIMRKNGGSRHDEPFRRGFLGTFEERAHLVHLLRTIDDRARVLLLLWFAASMPVAHIARRLRMSRVHCYRIKDQALDHLLKVSKGDAEARHLPTEGENGHPGRRQIAVGG